MTYQKAAAAYQSLSSLWAISSSSTGGHSLKLLNLQDCAAVDARAGGTRHRRRSGVVFVRLLVGQECSEKKSAGGVYD